MGSIISSFMSCGRGEISRLEALLAERDKRIALLSGENVVLREKVAACESNIAQLEQDKLEIEKLKELIRQIDLLKN